MRARHVGDRLWPGERHPVLPRSAGQRHPGLSPQALHRRPVARSHPSGASGGPGRPHRRCKPRGAACHHGRGGRARRGRLLHAGGVARLAAVGASALDGAARSRRAFRDGCAGAGSRARARPHRCDRESQPHRRPVHRAGVGAPQRQARRIVGRSADNAAADRRRRGFLPVAGRTARGICLHGTRSAAPHAGPASRLAARSDRGPYS